MGLAHARLARQVVVLAVCAVLAGSGWLWHHRVPTPAKPASLTATASQPVRVPSFANQELAFEPNQGQSDERVLFQSRGRAYDISLTADEALITLRGAPRPLSLRWQGSNPRPQVTGAETLPGIRNYLKGNDPARWQRHLPTYGKVHYRDLYPGIDLIYYGQQQQVEYDLVVAPGADPGQIRMQVAGMDSLQLGEDGVLRAKVAQREFAFSKPVIYQESAGARQRIEGGYVLLAHNQLGFRLEAYDKQRPLIIDPVLNYSTYLGGSGIDQGKGVAVDGSGNVYVVGQTASADFPDAAGAFNNGSTAKCNDPLISSTKVTCADVFVAKYNNSGELQAVTYLGGEGIDRGFAIAVDAAAVYITGDTDSTDFAGASNSKSGDTDAFIAKLDSGDLSLMYAAYLGGTDAEEALGIAVDSSGNAYVAGATLSDDFPVLGPYQPTRNASGACTNSGATIPCSDAFVAKYDSGGVKQYATYLGGRQEDVATAIAVDSSGNAYITGVTYSILGFPLVNNVQPDYGGGLADAFIVELNPAGDDVLYATCLGGNVWDQGQAIAVDNSGNIYVTGVTNSTTMALSLVNPLQTTYGGGEYDAFAVKLDPALAPVSQLKYFTYLGGSDKDFAFGIAVNKTSGTAVVVGETMSSDFPLKSPLQQIYFGDGSNRWGDAFVTQIGSSGSLGWSTYLGGGDDDWANAVALDGSNGIYVTGSSYSGDFPVFDPEQSDAAGASDALLVKLADSAVSADVALSVTATPTLVLYGNTLTYEIEATNNDTINAASGVTVQATLPAGLSFKSSRPAGRCTADGVEVICRLDAMAAGGSATLELNAAVATAGDITFTAEVVRANQPDPVSSNNSATITTKAGADGGGGVWSSLEWLMLVVASLISGWRVARTRRGGLLSLKTDRG